MSSALAKLRYPAIIGHRGLSAGSNLLLTIMAGRSLVIDDFAALALMIAIIGLILLVHSTLFSEPMLVYGANDYQPMLRRYLDFLNSGQLGAGIMIGIGIVLIGFTIDLSGSILFALAVPLVLSLDFQDRSFFMQINPIVPFFAALLQFATLALLLSLGPNLTSINGFLVVYVVSLVVANLVELVMRVRGRAKLGNAPIDYSEVTKRHLKFAAWSMTSHLMLFAVTNFYIFVLPLLQDMALTAAFRAQSALVGPGAQAFSALGMIALPMLRMTPDPLRSKRILSGFLTTVTVISVLTILVLGFFGQDILDLVYAGKYSFSITAYWLMGFYPLAIGYTFMVSSALRAADRADLVARSSLVAVVLTFLPGLFLIWRFGIEGVIIAQVLGCLVMSGTGALFLRHQLGYNTLGKS